ncbi:MAG: hypothetical protein AMXMBFR64_39740 [Myxococcales bacterium]
MSESAKLDEVLRRQAEQFREMLAEARQLAAALESKRRREARTDQAIAFLFCRALKFFDAYVCLVEARLGEPAAALVRSLYETSLLLRWVVRGERNAVGFFVGGQDEGGRTVRRLTKLLASSDVDLPDLPPPSVWTEEERRSPRPPGWEKLASAVGLGDLHDLIYGMLSAYSHGNAMGFGEHFARRTITGGPSPYDLQPLFPVANNVFLDCQRVYRTWIVERRVHEPPNVRVLLGIGGSME